MWIQTMWSTERKEATNTKLSEGEKQAIDIIKKETEKTKIEWLIKHAFNVPEGEKNIETKDTLNFLYKSMIDQIYVLYKTDKNQNFWRDDKTTLETAFFFMQLYNPDKYANKTKPFQSTAIWEKKDLFYAAVEQDMGNIFNTKHKLYEKYNTEKQIVDKDEYDQNKEKYIKEWWKPKKDSEKTVETTPEKILVEKEVNDFPKQYFYRWRSDVDINRWIQDMVPSITAKIKELKKNPDIDPTSIQLEVRSSVSNITYFDNKKLLWNRSNFVQKQLEWSLPNIPINTNNPEYTNYGSEWWPSYPPTVEELKTIFLPWSGALQALEKIWFASMEEVIKSITNQSDKSKYFDVLEQYMYREYQYAQVNVRYQERKKVPKDKQIVELNKIKEKSDLNDGMVTWTSWRIIAENPYFNQKPWIGVYEKENGVLFPLHARYIELQISDNKLTQPTERKPITEETYNFKKNHTITNTELKEWKSGKWVTASKELYLALDSKGVDVFSANLIKNDKNAGRGITNKETNKFINEYINQKEV